MKDNKEPMGWEERLMDEFCVMFERSGEEYPEKLEQFIQTLLDEQKEQIKNQINTKASDSANFFEDVVSASDLIHYINQL